MQQQQQQQHYHHTTNTFLRPIPEDRSDVATSSSLLALPPAAAAAGAATSNSSVAGVDAGREGSVVSSTRAELAQTNHHHHHHPTTTTSHDNRVETAERCCPPCRRWEKCGLSPCVVVTAILAVAAAVVAIVLVTVMDNDNDNIDSPPTMAPTIDPNVVQDLDAALNTLVTMPVVVVDTDKGQDTAGTPPPTTTTTTNDDDPRVRARDWMLYQDLLRDDLLAAGHVASILQRFIVVELYYATDGDVSWTTDTDPQVRLVDDDATTTGNETYTTVPFLTPHASECTWHGVYCSTDVDMNEFVYKIVLPNRNLTGTLPQSLYALSTLGEINVAQNQIRGPLPDLWFDDTALPSLLALDVDGNALTGTIPTALWSRPFMRFVYLNDNQFTGSVFTAANDNDNFAVSPFLEEVWLQRNLALTGPLPRWLFSQTNLVTFWASGNQFTGSLPPPGNMPSLEWLGLDHNRLSGSLQPGHLAGSVLRTVRLNNNSLTGTLPVVGGGGGLATPQAEGDTWPLQDLWLHDNALRGAIPVDFGLAWPNLRDLRLHGNPDLTGEITKMQCDAWLADGKEQFNYTADCPPILCSGGCCTFGNCQS